MKIWNKNHGIPCLSMYIQNDNPITPTLFKFQIYLYVHKINLDSRDALIYLMIILNHPVTNNYLFSERKITVWLAELLMP